MNSNTLFISGSVGTLSQEVVIGYLPTHYKFRNNLSVGLRNSFFNGSKQTEFTTTDNKLPFETFITNRNVLRVAAASRTSGQPILES